MPNVNKVMLMGNLTRDPQLSYTPDQCAVVDFGMATNRRWTDKGGNQKEEVTFVDLRMFGKRAEVVNKYCKKGQSLFVEGRLTFDSWEAQDGSKRSKLRVTVENFEFIGGDKDTKKSESKPAPRTGGSPPAEQDEFDEFMNGD